MTRLLTKLGTALDTAKVGIPVACVLTALLAPWIALLALAVSYGITDLWLSPNLPVACFMWESRW